MRLKRTLAGAVGVGLLSTVFLQCSSSPASRPIETGGSTGGTIGPGPGGSNAGSGGSDQLGGAGTLGTAGTISVEPPPVITDAGRPPRCDDEGHCSCINVGSLGKPAHYGANGMGSDNSDAFQHWLNTTSSASVKLITNKVPLTPEFLADFDVIVLQALEDAEAGPFWKFTDEEVAAFTDWVNNGGGVITMTGYGANADEVLGVNQLLKFTGISYNRDDILAKCPLPPPVNCFCTDNSVSLTGWQPASEIAKNITKVGAFYGRSISAPADAEVVATDGTIKYAVAKKVGKGKVFVFADEWVTYTSQWLGSTVTHTNNMNDTCYMKSADIVYQVPQFWYNVIKWVNPTQCVFKINDPAIIQ
jgi:hypothetical protein